MKRTKERGRGMINKESRADNKAKTFQKEIGKTKEKLRKRQRNERIKQEKVT